MNCEAIRPGWAEAVPTVGDVTASWLVRKATEP
jgi:hypothetical protein